MSHYHYPRVNFTGNCVIDPATANNSWFIPLVIFDPITIEHFLPPRVYIHDGYLIPGATKEKIMELLPEGCELKEDTTTRRRGATYFEIMPIQDEFDFKEWARIPLGESRLDREYWPLYHLFWVPTNRTTLHGCTPGYWNYYGSMSFTYVGVKVSSVALGIENQKELIFDDSSDNIPESVQQVLGSTLTMNTDPKDDSTNACVMVDHLPTMAMHTQLFVDRLSLWKDDKLLMCGRPMKGALRIVNAFRVVNQNMPFAGSGVFYSVLPIEQMDEEDSGYLLDMFRDYGDQGRQLKGVFVRQVLSEIEECRDIDYRTAGNKPNPAHSNLSGSLSPWYEGEMMSWPGGRQLIGDAPYILGRNEKLDEENRSLDLLHKKTVFDAPVSLMTPCVFNVRKDLGILQLDLLNNFPIRNRLHSQGPIEPSPHDDNEYETYPLGKMVIKLEAPDGEPGSGFHLGEFSISPGETPRELFYNNGGIFVFPLAASDDLNQRLDDWNVNIYGQNSLGKKVRLWKESPIIVTSDQSGLYCTQGDDPVKGYCSYSGKREPCRLRIFDRGRPVNDLIDITVVEIKMNISGSQISEKLYRNGQYKDGDAIGFGTYEPLNAIYLFLPYKTSVIPSQGYPVAVIRTGFFVNLKVLPIHDFGKYLDPTHEDYPTEVTFKVLVEEIFQTFSLLSPTMIFHEERFENPFMAYELLKRTSPENWDKSWYMPVTRDLSADEFALIQKWAEKYHSSEENLQSTEKDDSSQVHYHTHLKKADYFKR